MKGIESNNSNGFTKNDLREDCWICRKDEKLFLFWEKKFNQVSYILHLIRENIYLWVELKGEKASSTMLSAIWMKLKVFFWNQYLIKISFHSKKLPQFTPNNFQWGSVWEKYVSSDHFSWQFKILSSLEKCVIFLDRQFTAMNPHEFYLTC